MADEQFKEVIRASFDALAHRLKDHPEDRARAWFYFRNEFSNAKLDRDLPYRLVSVVLAAQMLAEIETVINKEKTDDPSTG